MLSFVCIDNTTFSRTINSSDSNILNIFVFVIKNKYNSGATHPDLYFYRDKSQKEVDVVEELAYPNLAIYEIKSAQSLKSDFFRNMAYFRKLFGDDVKSSTLIYDGDDERQMRANNTSCFNYRIVSDTKHLSKHAYGLAIDVNPLYNPYVRYSKKDGHRIVEPATGVPYADRKKDFRYKITIDDLCYKLFIKHGFTWGGAWRSMKDYQHFEYHLK